MTLVLPAIAGAEEARTHAIPVSQATGSARVGHHLGELIQLPVQHRDGSIAVGLVTLPDGMFQTTAEARLDDSGAIRILPVGKRKAEKAVRLLLELVGQERVGATIQLHSRAPVGRGFGSSSADCHAALRAVLNALSLPAFEVSDLDLLRRLVFPAEGPCDPLALLGWGVPVLWASRRGELLKIYDRPLPPMRALGFVLESLRMVSTDDLARGQAFSLHDVEEASPVLALFEKGLADGDVEAIGRSAAMSLALNQRHCPTARVEEVLRLAGETGAVGVAGSHSGTATCLLWPASVQESAIAAAEARLREWGAFYLHRFRPTSLVSEGSC